MAIITIILLISISLSLVHFGVYFLERDKASVRKAGVVIVSFSIFNNAFSYLGIQIPVAIETVLYIGLVSLLIWYLFKIKPLNSVTVATLYLVGRMAAVYLVSLVPLEILNA